MTKLNQESQDISKIDLKLAMQGKIGSNYTKI
jgi:hypothetical protein